MAADPYRARTRNRPGKDRICAFAPHN